MDSIRLRALHSCEIGNVFPPATGHAATVMVMVKDLQSLRVAFPFVVRVRKLRYAQVCNTD